MGTDYIDVFNLHGVFAYEYKHAIEKIVPALVEQKKKGKIRHIGITENPINDFTNEMLKRAVNDPVWTVYMVGFHMMHQIARKNVFPETRAKGIGTLLMFAVRSIFADAPRIAREMKAMAAKGLVEKWLGETQEPLGLRIHEGGAPSMTEAAYLYARHQRRVCTRRCGPCASVHHNCDGLERKTTSNHTRFGHAAIPGSSGGSHRALSDF